MSRPTIVIVPAACQPTALYEPLAKALQKQQYAVEVVSTPSVGGSLRTFDEDVVAVRKTVVSLADKGADIVVLMHSYGGVPGSAALRGLGNAERVKAGKHGGVIRLVYAAAFALREGEAVPTKGDYEALKSYSVVDEEADTFTLTREAAEWSMFHDIPASDGGHWFSLMKPQSIGALWSDLTYAAWEEIPSTYVVCETDRVIPLESQESMIANAKEVQPTAFDVVERINCGHEPIWSNIDDLVRILNMAADSPSL
ncbi:MAG: hypothetical protein M1837_001510 [Sclerophora amabilis]|nr:MAG: hypothetical protein M1837_001510 [Sclerophora amabilis]